ncbi:unnamed protein product [Musa banksii]
MGVYSNGELNFWLCAKKSLGGHAQDKKNKTPNSSRAVTCLHGYVEREREREREQNTKQLYVSHAKSCRLEHFYTCKGLGEVSR